MRALLIAAAVTMVAGTAFAEENRFRDEIFSEHYYAPSQLTPAMVEFKPLAEHKDVLGKGDRLVTARLLEKKTFGEPVGHFELGLALLSAKFREFHQVPPIVAKE